MSRLAVFDRRCQNGKTEAATCHAALTLGADSVCDAVSQCARSHTTHASDRRQRKSAGLEAAAAFAADFGGQAALAESG